MKRQSARRVYYRGGERMCPFCDESWGVSGVRMGEKHGCGAKHTERGWVLPPR